MSTLCVNVAIDYQNNGESATFYWTAEASVSAEHVRQLRVAGAHAVLDPQIKDMVAQARAKANAGGAQR